MAEILTMEYVEGKTKVTLAGTVTRGDLIGYSTGWKTADANVAAGPIYAQLVAMNDGVSGDEIEACRSCTIYDGDAPYTAGSIYYTSGTAGEATLTKPTTGGDLIQVVGVGLSTSRLKLDIKAPMVQTLFFNADTYDTTGEPGLGVVDAGWTGPDLDAAGEDAYVKGRLPDNMVSLLSARILINSTALTAIDLDLTITGGYDGADNNEDTGAAQTTQDLDSGADNKLCYIEIAGASHLMDAGFATPGRNFSVWLDTDGVTGGTAMVLGVAIVCLVV